MYASANETILSSLSNIFKISNVVLPTELLYLSLLFQGL